MIKIDDLAAARGSYSSVCSFCRHYRVRYRCAAFDFIPNVIWFGIHDHKTPYPRDGGIQFEPRKIKAKK